jgi:hypothetical protein
MSNQDIFLNIKNPVITDCIQRKLDTLQTEMNNKIKNIYVETKETKRKYLEELGDTISMINHKIITGSGTRIEIKFRASSSCRISLEGFIMKHPGVWHGVQLLVTHLFQHNVISYYLYDDSTNILKFCIDLREITSVDKLIISQKL